MNTVNDTYAVYQANQVLTEAQLNETRDYLDEQERLTRADLIGIGILCGLDASLAGTTVSLTKGCGVTSQGYLIVEPNDVDLLFWNDYTLPDQLPYPPLHDGTGKQFPLWELSPTKETGSRPLAAGELDLGDKAMLLLLELRRQGMRTCAPDDCDDRGSAVTATVRRLLIRTADLTTMLAAAGADPGTEAGVLDRLTLPDLRMPRVDVPNSGPVTSADVLAAFQRAFRDHTLVNHVATALGEAYRIFRPLLAAAFPNDPFTDVETRFGFLDTVPKTIGQVRFLQYYWDLFDDLIRAYDDFRWAGTELLAVCCPPAGLFPRHLALGVLDPTSVAEPAGYRHRFLPSPATARCGDLLVLFRRLVAMLDRFTDEPPLPKRDRGRFDSQIRITPSVYGPGPLSAAAIPYYYESDGTTPLHQVWNPEQTRRRRADRNLGYRADKYGTAPDFVLDPLAYGLEPYNFLRVEGHLGKALGTTMATLLHLRTTYRLPIEVVALRTGAFDESIPVDLTGQDCRFDDLEALYATLKAELICFLCKQVQYFYGLPSPGTAAGTVAREPILSLLRACDPGFRVQPETVGRVIENMLARTGFFAVGQSGAGTNVEFLAQTFSLVNAMSALFGELTADVRHLDAARFATGYGNLVESATAFEAARAAVRPGTDNLFTSAGLADRLTDIVWRCRLEPFRALQAEYRRRFKEAQQAQLLSTFLDRHPGVQHHAGVPLGGTFILVYHESTNPSSAPAPPPRVTDGDALAAALGRLRFDPTLTGNAQIQEVYQLLTGTVLVGRKPPEDIGERIYVDAEAELADGTVIADFFLPYSLHSECPPIQFTLSADRPRLTLRRGCTNADGNAEVTLTVEGGTGTAAVRVDNGTFTEFTGKVLLPAGSHTVVVRDAAGSESAPTPIVVPAALAIGPATITEDTKTGTYQVGFTVSGGTEPYRADPGTIVKTAYTSTPIAGGDKVTVTIGDANGCTVSQDFQHNVDKVCTLPFDGKAIRAGHRFWVPEPTSGFPINDYTATDIRFLLGDPQGATIDLTAEVTAVVSQAPNPLPSTRFATVVAKWLDQINGIIAARVGSPDWLRLDYVPPAAGFTTGTLLIDRLIGIELQFILTVRFSQAKRTQAIQTTYDAAKGTSVVLLEGSGRAFLPPSDPVTSNKCRPKEEPVEVCKPGLTIDFTADVGRDRVTLLAKPSGPAKAESFVWEVQDGTLGITNGLSTSMGFDPAEPAEKLVRLTAYTAEGCSASVVRAIKTGG
ncbi:hypothetical protein [Actinoplanes sp. NPDC026670]|uniref:hypothetical protein n=1 Tax=Actinoplanes sp. NPDC026670 TaxID=3154700 RepID=UPI0033F9A1D5